MIDLLVVLQLRFKPPPLSADDCHLHTISHPQSSKPLRSQQKAQNSNQRMIAVHSETSWQTKTPAQGGRLE
jgi:hypothetical protein